jgi:hypothetical protein
MTVRITPEAQRDLIEGAHFYDAQELGCGAMFLDHLDLEIARLKTSAGRHARHQGYYRALTTPRFPYAIHYLIYGDEAVVMAVQDCRRDPETIKSILQSRRTQS